MKDLLARASRGLLVQLAHSKVLVAFDFDGTLAPIVADRHQAEMRETTRRLFGQVASRYPTAVISGRSEKDVRERLQGLGAKYVMGNHGLEPGLGIWQFEAEVRAALPVLAERLADVQGIDVEDKRYSFAIHYRRARQKVLARRAILAVASALPSAFRVIPGKLVMNLVPRGAAHKGDALLELRALEGADTALYVGDDVTDEDVFSLDQPGRLLTVRVGRAKSSAASYFLRDQKQIDRLLRVLVELREGAPSA